MWSTSTKGKTEGERDRQPILFNYYFLPLPHPPTTSKKKTPSQEHLRVSLSFLRFHHPQGSFLNSKPGWYSKHQSTFTLQAKLTHCVIKKPGGETAAQPIKSRVCMACHLFITWSVFWITQILITTVIFRVIPYVLSLGIPFTIFCKTSNHQPLNQWKWWNLAKW